MSSEAELSRLYADIAFPEGYVKPGEIVDLVRQLNKGILVDTSKVRYKLINFKEFTTCLLIATHWYQRTNSGQERIILLVRAAIDSLNNDCHKDPKNLIDIMCSVVNCWDEKIFIAVEFKERFINRFDILAVAHEFKNNRVPTWFREYIWTRVRDLALAHLRDIGEY